MTDATDFLPPVLRGLCEWALENPPPDEAQELRAEFNLVNPFREDLIAALHGSTADLELVGWRVVHTTLKRLPLEMPEIDVIIGGIGKIAEGGVWERKDAERAADRADNAASAAQAQWFGSYGERAAAYAAECAAWAAGYAANAYARPAKTPAYAGRVAAWAVRASAWARAANQGPAAGAVYSATKAYEIRIDILGALRND